MATIGGLYIETGLTTAGLKRDLDAAMVLVQAGARQMKDTFDKAGPTAFSGLQESTAKATTGLQDVEGSLHVVARAVHSLAAPITNELGPAFGGTIGHMARFTAMSLSVEHGMAGMALAGAGVAGLLANQLYSAWRQNIEAKREFDMAMRTGDLGTLQTSANKARIELVSLHDELARGARMQTGMQAGITPYNQAAKTFERNATAQKMASQGVKVQVTEDAAATAKAVEDYQKAVADAYKNVPAVQAREQEARFQKNEADREKARVKAEQDAKDASRAVALRAEQDARLLEEWRQKDLADSEAAWRGKAQTEEEFRQRQQDLDQAANQWAKEQEDFLLRESLSQARYRMDQEEKLRQQNADAEAEGRRAREDEERFLLAESLDQARYRMAQTEREGAEWRGLFTTVNMGIGDLITTTQSWGDAVARVGERIASTLIDTVLRKALLPAEEALATFLTKLAQVAGTSIASGLGWGGTAAAPTAVSDVGPYASGYVFPGMASGGIVMRPTAAIVGESGPEAVIPLSQYGRGGGGETVVNVIDQRGANAPAAQVRQSQQDDRKVIDVVITDSVTRGFAAGAFDKIMISTYGVGRRGVRG